jgi:hypothetical protein
MLHTNFRLDQLGVQAGALQSQGNVCQEDRRHGNNSEPSRAPGLRIMSGRDPYEQHRVATPLELCFA